MEKYRNWNGRKWYKRIISKWIKSQFRTMLRELISKLCYECCDILTKKNLPKGECQFLLTTLSRLVALLLSIKILLLHLQKPRSTLLLVIRLSNCRRKLEKFQVTRAKHIIRVSAQYFRNFHFKFNILFMCTLLKSICVFYRIIEYVINALTWKRENFVALCWFWWKKWARHINKICNCLWILRSTLKSHLFIQ